MMGRFLILFSMVLCAPTRFTADPILRRIAAPNTSEESARPHRSRLTIWRGYIAARTS